MLRTPIATLFLLAATAPALAVCPVCNAAVRFNQTLAACFQSRVEGELQRLKAEGRGFVIVDLSDCEKAGDRGGLPTGPLDDAAALALDASFIADDAGLRCLGDAIATHPGKLDPSVLFDLTQICS
jgi:hypothetical protein